MSAYTEALIVLNDDLIAIESKVVELRAKYDGVEKQDPVFVGILDEITAAFEALKSAMSRIDSTASQARSKINDDTRTKI